MHLDVEAIQSFEQDDANDYTLHLFGYADDEAGTEVELRLCMSTMEAMRLFGLADRVIGGHHRTMVRELAAYNRASDEERAEVLGLNDPDICTSERWLDYADHARKAAKENQ